MSKAIEFLSIVLNESSGSTRKQLGNRSDSGDGARGSNFVLVVARFALS